jgi:hypothetical protein
MTERYERPAFKISVTQLQCTMCGAETHAACSCGAIYRPKAQQAAEAVAAHPEKSNRAIAEEIGADEKTVRQARDSTADQSAVEGSRIGLDGKKRKLPSYIPEPPPQIRDWLIEQALDAVRQMTPAERVEFIRQVGRV